MKMRFLTSIITISFFYLFVYGCQNQNENNAGIPPEKMELLLWDMNRAGIYAHDYIGMDSTKNDSIELKAMRDAILEKYKVTEKEYELSYQYYLNHPDQMVAIIDSIQARSKKQTRAMEKIFRPE